VVFPSEALAIQVPLVLTPARVPGQEFDMPSYLK